MKKIILKTLIITFIISALLGIGIVLLDIWTEITARILLSTVTIFSASIPGLCCSISYEKSKNKVVPLIGMIITTISCIYFLLLVWELITFKWTNEFAWNFMATCIILPISLGHISLLLLQYLVMDFFLFYNILYNFLQNLIKLFFYKKFLF